MEILLKSIRRTRNMMLLVGLLILGLGLFLLAMDVLKWDSSAPDMSPALIWVGRAFWILFIVVGLAGMRVGIRYINPENAPLMRVILSEPDSVSWVFEYIVDSGMGIKNIGKSSTIFVNCIDKKRYPLMVSQKNAKEVMDFLKEKFPHAHFGHTKEIEKQYNANPSSLLHS